MTPRRTRMAGRARLAIVAAALATAAAGAHAVTNPIGEAQATAGFLFNCAMFVEWPPSVPVNGDILLGIVGTDPVADLIDDLQGRKVNGRVLRVKLVQPSDDVRAFHILFLADGPGADTAGILARVGDAPVLTVGEERDFTSKGGVVRLYTEQARLRFEINMTRAEQAGLKVSARMLGLARIVR